MLQYFSKMFETFDIYIQLFEDIFEYLKMSSNELKISSII